MLPPVIDEFYKPKMVFKIEVYDTSKWNFLEEIKQQKF